MKLLKIQTVIALLALAFTTSVFAQPGPPTDPAAARALAIQAVVESATPESLADDLAAILGDNPSDDDVQAAAQAIQSSPNSGINTPAQLSSVLQSAGVPVAQANTQAQAVMTAAATTPPPAGTTTVDSAGVLTDSSGNAVVATSEEDLLAMTLAYVDNQVKQSGGNLTPEQESSIQTLVTNSLVRSGVSPSSASNLASSFTSNVKSGGSNQSVSNSFSNAANDNDLGDNDLIKDTIKKVSTS